MRPVVASESELIHTSTPVQSYFAGEETLALSTISFTVTRIRQSGTRCWHSGSKTVILFCCSGCNVRCISKLSDAV